MNSSIKFSKRVCGYALIAPALLLQNPAAAISTAVFEGIGFPGTAYGVSDTTAGNVTVVGESEGQAFIWRSETPETLWTANSSGYSAAYGVSSDGSVVVGESDQKPAIWVNGVLQPDLNNGAEGVARAVSADGNFVVGYFIDPFSISHMAFVYDRDNDELSLLTPESPYTQTEALGISNDGTKIIGSQIATNLLVPTIWSNPGFVPTAIGSATNVAPFGISDLGVIVGITDQFEQAYFQNGAWQVLGTGGFGSITAAGDYAVGFDEFFAAVIFDGTTLTTLSSFLAAPPHDNDLSGWSLSGFVFVPSATPAIARDGKAIAGGGIHGTEPELWLVRFVESNERTFTAEITGPQDLSPRAVNTNIAFTASLQDSGGGAHSATWKFTSSAGPIEIPATVSGNLISLTTSFADAGVYQVSLEVTNDEQNTISVDTFNGSPMYIVIYNPNDGFVTGGAWSNTSYGRTTVALNAKYHRNSTVPSGNTNISFAAPSGEFKSTSYDWLVVNGNTATYRGSGKLNGVSGYTFTVSVVDNGEPGRNDTFRVCIFNAMGAAVYDTGTVTLGGGNIQVHR